MLPYLVLLLSMTSVLSLSSGAPESACLSFFPGHSGARAQTSQSLYVIQSSLDQLQPGGSLEVTISSPQRIPFQGYIVQARNPMGAGEALGTFTNVPSTEKIINCGANNHGNTVTHTTKVDKYQLQFTWQAPFDYNGPIVFNGTILQNYKTFWVGVRSSEVYIEEVYTNSDHNVELTSYEPMEHELTSYKPVSITTSYEESPTNSNYGPNPTIAPKTHTSINGCNSTKLCFGIPDGCVANHGSCETIVSVAYNGKKFVEFEMEAKNSAYVAVGLSQDYKMGNDNVVECVRKEASVKEIWIYMSTNKQHSNKRTSTSANTNGVNLVEGSFLDGTIYCKFSRATRTVIEGAVYDLATTPYVLLLASGPIKDVDTITYHKVKGASAKSHYLTVPPSPKQKSDASAHFLRLNSALLISAGICVVLFKSFL